MKRVFVRGISRSGGTLMVTVLDAHPDLAMCYEIYERLLSPVDDEADPIDRFVTEIEQTFASTRKKVERHFGKKPAMQLEDKRLRTFVHRARRAGVEPDQVLDLLREHRAGGFGLATFADRMKLIEGIAMKKAEQEGKAGWGSKIATVYDETIELWPDAKILFMLRDGRDVAASRKKTGDFAQSIENIAEGYVTQVERFERFAGKHPESARIVSYERLVQDPEPELRSIVDFLEMPWSDRLLQHESLDLTLFKTPTGHLSAEQVNKPINTSSIGRWRDDLDTKEVTVFESIAGSLLERHGYGPSAVGAH